MNAVELQHVSHSFAQRSVFHELSLHVSPTERVLIFGDNGSGKSTLTKLISGQLTPNSGRIVIFGKNQQTLLAHLPRTLGYLPCSDLGLFQGLSGKDNIYFFSRLCLISESKTKDRIDRWTNIIPLFQECLETKFSFCSTGMKLLLRLFVLTLQNPPILILDEPFRSVSPENQRLLCSLLHIEFDKAAIILTSHYSKIEHYQAHVVYELKDGKIA